MADRKWPDRYDKKAAELTVSFRNPDSFYASDSIKVAEALRAAAKEAQLRVLDRVLLQRTTAGSWQEQRLLALKAAIESGEDV